MFVMRVVRVMVSMVMVRVLTIRGYSEFLGLFSAISPSLNNDIDDDGDGG